MTVGSTPRYVFDTIEAYHHGYAFLMLNYE